MDTFILILIGIASIAVVVALTEYRIRKPDMLILFESKDKIETRKGLFYPKHFSLSLKRTAHPIQLNTEVTATGNLGVRVKLVGSVGPDLENLDALIRAGGWTNEAIARAAEEAQVLLQGLIQSYTEQHEIQSLSSNEILNALNHQAAMFSEKLGLEIISLAIISMEPVDPEITNALRQQEQARLLEQTERLNHQARAAAAKARYQIDEEITTMNHDLELKKTKLNKVLIEEEATLAQQRLEHELERNRLRLSFEKEEIEILRNSPELLMLTPQAARLAEASQNLKNARTVISFTPQELAQGTELLKLFQALIQNALESKNNIEEEE